MAKRNILIIGSGGREHAFGWKLSQSEQVKQLFFLPGNAGTASLGTNIEAEVTDFAAIQQSVIDNQIDMVVVSPEVPLVKGIVDYFTSDTILKNIPIIGPSKAAAQLEGSKEFAKEFMKRHNIPTARYLSVNKDNIEFGIEFLQQLKSPFVLKADGLASGKGVLIINDLNEAIESLRAMVDGMFGKASATVVIEEFLSGVECSIFVITDGKSYKILPEAKDYKRIGEGDSGLNTGGMGAVSPVAFVDADFLQKVENQIIVPTIDGLKKENIDYKGFIFFGIINCGGNPFVIEYNVRMGDPETEAVILRIKSDLYELFDGIANRNLSEKKLEIDAETAVTVMLVSGGYPENYQNGFEINNLGGVTDSIVFHAGTKLSGDKIQTNGGRVLAISSIGNDISDALSKSYKNGEIINFERKYYRRDIGIDLINK